jgi:hypothetical protein
MAEEDINEIIVPEYEDFLDKLYSLNPVGKADLYYAVMREKLGTILYNKEPLTFELLIKKYIDYLSYLKPFNDIKDKQYIKKDKIIKGIGEYLTTGEFNNDYSAMNGNPNDTYLFGI